MIIQLGNMYIEHMDLENFDNEFSVRFTSKVSEAKEFDINETYIIDVLRALFDIEFNIINLPIESE